jgi:hypothetical protein
MLIEVKVKVARIDDGKTRKVIETYVLDKDFFSEAEYCITSLLSTEQNSHLIDSFELVSLRQSTIKEIDEQSITLERHSFMATLKDVFHEDDGTEKYIKYKVLLWADNLTEANRRALELSHQGYDMLIEGIKQVDYIYIQEEDEE